MATLVVLTGTNCGGEDPWPPQRMSGYTDGSSLAQPHGNEALDTLCFEHGSDRNKEVIFVAPGMDETCEASGMEETLEPLAFTIFEKVPQSVLLYGRPNVQYCFGVLRLSGYLTISHPHGDVYREGDQFRWCVVPVTDLPEYMIVRSLTPSASFELSALP